MKPFALFLIVAVCQLCFAGEDTNVIALSEWSTPVSLRNDEGHDRAVRGRLLIVQGTEPAYGGPKTTNAAMTFVELQHVTESCCGDIDLYFDVTKLNCELSDATGRVVPKPSGGGGSGRGAFVPCWVKLPYNSTIRLFVNGGYIDPLVVFPSGEPWRYWSISKSDTNIYYLSGTLGLSTHTNTSYLPELNDRHYSATLAFPKTRITNPEWARTKRQNTQ